MGIFRGKEEGKEGWEEREGRRKKKRGEGMKGRGRMKDEGEERISPHEETNSFEVLEGVWKLYFIVSVFCMRCTDV